MFDNLDFHMEEEYEEDEHAHFMLFMLAYRATPSTIVKIGYRYSQRVYPTVLQMVCKNTSYPGIACLLGTTCFQLAKVVQDLQQTDGGYHIINILRTIKNRRCKIDTYDL